MTDKPTISPEYRQKITAFLTKLAQLAEKLINKILLLVVFNLATISWLLFYLNQWVDLSITSNLISFVIIAIPALILIKLYDILDCVIQLPENIKVLWVDMKDMKHTLTPKQLAFEKIDETKSKLSRLFTMAKSLVQVKNLFDGVTAVPETIINALLLSNPLFIMLVSISMLLTGLFALLAALTTLIYIL